MAKVELEYEKIRRLGGLELLARQLVEGFITGLHKSPYHGFSVEFSEHRLYNPGEFTRHMDWKVFARTDRLYVKRYEEETNLRCQLIVDVLNSMLSLDDTNYKPSIAKREFAVYAAASLAELMQRQRDAVGLMTFNGSGVLHQSPIKSTASHKLLLFKELENTLNAAPAKTDPQNVPLAEDLHRVARQLPQRSLVVLFSDFMEDPESFEALFPALQHLRHRHHEILIFSVLNEEAEEKLAYPNRPTIFEDVETGKRVKLNPAAARASYQAAVKKRKEALLMRCSQYRIDLEFIDVNSKRSIEDVLLGYLIKRRKMK